MRYLFSFHALKMLSVSDHFLFLTPTFIIEPIKTASCNAVLFYINNKSENFLKKVLTKSQTAIIIYP